MAPNRNDFKVVPTPHGMRAPYQDWPSPEHCPDRTPMPYKLYAVVVHLGTMIGGHYIAYVLVDPERLFTPPGAEAGIAEHMEQMSLDEGEGKREKVKDRRVWCYCSDTEIRLASVDEVMAAKAYLCFVSDWGWAKLTAVREVLSPASSATVRLSFRHHTATIHLACTHCTTDHTIHRHTDPSASFYTDYANTDYV